MRIRLPWVAGDYSTYLEIVEVPGAMGSIHIMLDNFFQGQMVYSQGEWRGHFNTTLFTGIEIQIIGEAIDRWRSENTLLP